MLTISTNVFELDSRWSEACFALPRLFHLLYPRHYEHCTFTGCSYPIGSMHGIICTYTLVDFYGKYIIYIYLFMYTYTRQGSYGYGYCCSHWSYFESGLFLTHFAEMFGAEPVRRIPTRSINKYVYIYINIHMNYMHILIYTHLPWTRFAFVADVKFSRIRLMGARYAKMKLKLLSVGGTTIYPREFA